jgi:alpha-maltose-1-phosphate synthase
MTAPLKVLSLNIYIMGHITYQDVLEKTFGKHIPEIEFDSIHLTDYFKQDLLGRLVYWLLSKQLPGTEKADYDFHRFRTELALSFFARRCLERRLKNAQPDVLHLHTQAIAFLAIPLFKKFPSVVSIDYTTALLANQHPYPSHVTYRPIIAAEKKCFEAAAHIISWSDKARNSVIQDYKISPEKVTTIRPALPLDIFNSIARKPAKNDKIRLLFVGNDFARKGGEDLLAVFLEDFTNVCELDIVTNAPLNLPNLPNLRIHRGISPLSPELINLYQNADIFVMPTYEDVYGLVFGEAMAAGLPCIGTNIVAVPELVQNGQNGFTIIPGDRKALSQTLRQLIANPNLRLSMGQASQEFARKKLDALSNCQQISRIFTNLEKGKMPC